MAYNVDSFQLKMMLSSEFLLLIDHTRKFYTANISGYTVFQSDTNY